MKKRQSQNLNSGPPTPDACFLTIEFYFPAIKNVKDLERLRREIRKI